ncbi:MOSC domain-containing protein [Iningainema tapete]|uniref:MOSC N-terminal beta barrel domain-containing protein n=1 Tax=Iningainema tapete BLCC-T55 TaxID=2748662 RepID=A0A8J6XCA5_9CYAN|nr:MOSC N-terminal beta barrel domain-containing protein [Iningainema tapete]MBD2772314.1 MOSC N-terminal beta barrel domain-containing protein [Iningainema tapete BLCC-T55]
MSNTSPHLVSIFIYPIKSLDGFAVNQTTLLQSGALEHDREFALFDERGNFVNGKRNAQVHLLRTWFDVDYRIISLQIQNKDQKFIFHVDKERADLEAWLSNYFGFSVKFVQNSITGFPDDTNASGPTIISTATLEVVASWFPDLSVDELRIRLRTNLEIGGVPAFWEEQLFAEANFFVQFQVGDVLFAGINPCQRCVVPARNSQTGEITPNFQKIFIAKRREFLPSWTTISRFNHFFKLAVNTKVPESEAGKILRIGDPVKVIGISKRI